MAATGSPIGSEESHGPLRPGNAYYRLIRDNREVCSHCFSRIRSVSTFEDAAEVEWKYYKRRFLSNLEESRAVDSGTIGYDNYRTTLRWDQQAGEYLPGTGTMEPRVACNQCGWLGTRTQNRDLSIREMEKRVPQLIKRLVWQAARAGYRVSINIDELYRQIGRLKTTAEYSSGKDTEVFSMAIERSISVQER